MLHSYFNFSLVQNCAVTLAAGTCCPPLTSTTSTFGGSFRNFWNRHVTRRGRGSLTAGAAPQENTPLQHDYSVGRHKNVDGGAREKIRVLYVTGDPALVVDQSSLRTLRRVVDLKMEIKQTLQIPMYQQKLIDHEGNCMDSGAELSTLLSGTRSGADNEDTKSPVPLSIQLVRCEDPEQAVVAKTDIERQEIAQTLYRTGCDILSRWSKQYSCDFPNYSFEILKESVPQLADDIPRVKEIFHLVEALFEGRSITEDLRLEKSHNHPLKMISNEDDTGTSKPFSFALTVTGGEQSESINYNFCLIVDSEAGEAGEVSPYGEGETGFVNIEIRRPFFSRVLSLASQKWQWTWETGSMVDGIDIRGWDF